MRLGLTAILTGVAACAACLAAFAPPAAAVPVEVNVTALRTIQTFNLDKKADDQCYLLVSGYAKGQPISDRLPKEKTWAANRKKMAVTEKAPATLWKGDLANGEFAVVTVTLMQGRAPTPPR